MIPYNGEAELSLTRDELYDVHFRVDMHESLPVVPLRRLEMSYPSGLVELVNVKFAPEVNFDFTQRNSSTGRKKSQITFSKENLYSNDFSNVFVICDMDEIQILCHYPNDVLLLCTSGIYYFEGYELLLRTQPDLVRTDQGKPVLSAVYSYAHYQDGYNLPMNLLCMYTTQTPQQKSPPPS